MNQEEVNSKQFYISPIETGIPESIFEDIEDGECYPLMKIIEENADGIRDKINDYITKNIEISDGDILCFVENPYRNNFKFIWYDNCIHNLDDTVDEYGSLPKTDTLLVKPNSRFHPRYWNDTIVHNGYYYVCNEYIKECTENIHKIKDKYNNNLLVTHFTHSGCVETVVLNPDLYDPNMSLKELKKLFINSLETGLFNWDEIGIEYEGYDFRYTSMV